ncbi:MAG: NAD-dependent epimerase/dehydratase family protein [Longimicrobiaceae bacterium]
MSVRGEVVLVTGASGFLGRPVTRALLERGARVRGLARPGSAPLEPGVEPAPVEGLHDRAGLARAVEGAHAVVHLAARVHLMRDTAADPPAEFRRVNVEGTRAVLEEAIRAGARRFVHASSVKALGEGGGAVLTDDTRPAPADPYGVSKLEAERVVRELADAAGVHAAILRFPLVYGPGVGANFLKLIQTVDKGVPLPFGRVRNRRSAVYVGNAAAAVVAALESPAAARETFLVSDGDDVSTPELVRRIARALGRTARLIPIPPALFALGGKVGDLLSRAVPFPLTSAAVHRLLGSLAVDSSRFGRLTGFAPPFTMDEGLAATAAWYRERGRAG